MKRSIALILILLAGCIVFANINDNLPANLNSAFTLGAKNSSSLQVNFTLPEYSMQEETYGGAVYHKTILPLSTQQTVIPNFLPYPVQQGNSSESPKGFIINNEYYNSGNNYPEMLIEYSEPSILRDFRIITIQINPFSYNAQTGSNQYPSQLFNNLWQQQ